MFVLYNRWAIIFYTKYIFDNEHMCSDCIFCVIKKEWSICFPNQCPSPVDPFWPDPDTINSLTQCFNKIKTQPRLNSWPYINVLAVCEHVCMGCVCVWETDYWLHDVRVLLKVLIKEIQPNKAKVCSLNCENWKNDTLQRCDLAIK